MGFLLVSLLFLQIAPSASGADTVTVLTAQLDVERQLLAEDLRLFATARREQIEALGRLETALAAIDVLVEGRSVSVAELEGLEAEASLAEVGVAGANSRSGEIRRRLYDRLRRTSALEGRIEVEAVGSLALADPLSGRWSLELDPDDQEGWLELRFSTNLVTGSYRLENGGGGSLRGTYSGGNLRLEKVDSLRGLDAIWVGEIDPVTRKISGYWTAMELADGRPARGDWKAEKLLATDVVEEPEEPEEDEIEP